MLRRLLSLRESTNAMPVALNPKGKSAPAGREGSTNNSRGSPWSWTRMVSVSQHKRKPWGQCSGGVPLSGRSRTRASSALPAARTPEGVSANMVWHAPHEPPFLDWPLASTPPWKEDALCECEGHSRTCGLTWRSTVTVKSAFGTDALVVHHKSIEVRGQVCRSTHVQNVNLDLRKHAVLDLLPEIRNVRISSQSFLIANMACNSSNCEVAGRQLFLCATWKMSFSRVTLARPTLEPRTE